MPIPFPLSSYFSSCSFVAASNFGNQILGIASILPSSNASHILLSSNQTLVAFTLFAKELIPCLLNQISIFPNFTFYKFQFLRCKSDRIFHQNLWFHPKFCQSATLSANPAPPFNNQTLNRYPTPQIVSIYCGFAVLNSIFSRIFLICTVTVAISPIDSISQILLNNSSFVYT